MKRHNIILLLLCFLIIACISGCNKKEDTINNKNQTFAEESIKNVTVVIENLEFQVPSSWLIFGNQMRKNSIPVLQIEVSSFDEKKLMSEFQYKDTEECVRSFLPNGIYLKRERANIKEVNGLSVFEFVCNADKYSESEDMFVESDDLVYLDYIVQPEEKKLYCLYFMKDMANEEQIKLFLEDVQTIKINDEKNGQYRWMVTDE